MSYVCCNLIINTIGPYPSFFKNFFLKLTLLIIFASYLKNKRFRFKVNLKYNESRNSPKDLQTGSFQRYVQWDQLYYSFYCCFQRKYHTGRHWISFNKTWNLEYLTSFLYRKDEACGYCGSCWQIHESLQRSLRQKEKRVTACCSLYKLRMLNSGFFFTLLLHKHNTLHRWIIYFLTITHGRIFFH